MHCTCIACITIDFAMKMKKKELPTSYFEQWTKYVYAELESDTELEPKSELKSDSE